MRKLCAIFEDWFLGDGIYPPFRKGQQQQLSFMLRLLTSAQTGSRRCYFTQLQDAEYVFGGRIIRHYELHNNRQLVVIDTGSYIFYFEEPADRAGFAVGHFIEGRAQLLVDYNLYFEQIDYSGAPFSGLFQQNSTLLLLNYCLVDRDRPESRLQVPGLLYSLSVRDIIKVTIPSRFLTRKDNCLSYPASLMASEYSLQDRHLIADMALDTDGPSFYLLQLEENCWQ